MDILLQVIRVGAPAAFILLCVFSYASGALFTFMAAKVYRGPTSAVFRGVFAIVSAFRLYVSGREEVYDVLSSSAPPEAQARHAAL